MLNPSKTTAHLKFAKFCPHQIKSLYSIPIISKLATAQCTAPEIKVNAVPGGSSWCSDWNLSTAIHHNTVSVEQSFIAVLQQNWNAVCWVAAESDWYNNAAALQESMTL